jgi:hypothetical protein
VVTRTGDVTGFCDHTGVVSDSESSEDIEFQTSPVFDFDALDPLFEDPEHIIDWRFQYRLKTRNGTNFG